jgi:hypothetical protein
VYVYLIRYCTTHHVYMCMLLSLYQLYDGLLPYITYIPIYCSARSVDLDAPCLCSMLAFQDNYQYARGPQVPFVNGTPGGSSTPDTQLTPSAISALWRRMKAGRMCGVRMFTSGASGNSENFSQPAIKQNGGAS